MSEAPQYKTVKNRVWPWLSGKSPYKLLNCSLFARKKRCERTQINFISHNVFLDWFQKVKSPTKSST